MRLSPRLKNKIATFGLPALAILSGAASFFWLATHPGEIRAFSLGLVIAACLLGLVGWTRRTLIPNLFALGLAVVLFGVGGFSFVLQDSVFARVLVVVLTLGAAIAILHQTFRRAALVALVFGIGNTAAALTTFLQLPPTLIGLYALAPIFIVLMMDRMWSATIKADDWFIVASAAFVGVQILVAALSLPLTFAATGALLVVSLVALREAMREVASGLFSHRFLKKIFPVALGAGALLIATGRW